MWLIINYINRISYKSLIEDGSYFYIVYKVFWNVNYHSGKIYKFTEIWKTQM